MRKSFVAISSGLLFVALCGGAYAQSTTITKILSDGTKVTMLDGAAQAKPECIAKKVATLNLEFNFNRADPVGTDAFINSKVTDIKDSATKLNISTIEMSSLEYTVSLQRSNNNYYENGDVADKAYRVNGRMSFVIEPSEKAADLLAGLDKTQYRPTVQVRITNQCARQLGGY